MKSIRPDLLAARFAAAAKGDQPDFALLLSESPRRAEMLWFIQHASIQPGGLPGLVNRLLKMFPERFQTKAMLAAQPDRRGLYSIEQCLKVWNEVEIRMDDFGLLTMSDDLYNFGPKSGPDISFADLMPEQPRVVADLPQPKPAVRKTPALELPPRSSRLAEREPEAGATEFPRRLTTPARLIQEPLTVA